MYHEIDPLDIIGKRFGKLTVLDHVGMVNGSRSYLCICDCGNVVEVKRNNLISGHARSCGCSKGNYKPWTRGFDPLDIVGQKFGRLTVEKYEGITGSYTSSKTHSYLCRCECGNTKQVTRSNLLQGITKSCGCLRKENCRKVGKASYSKKEIEPKWNEEPKKQLPFPDDIIGEVEGRLACIKRLYQRKDRNWMYLVRCECGNEFELDRGNFLLGQSRCPECGCIARHRKPAHYKEPKTRIDVDDIVGKRFGRLTVLEYDHMGYKGKNRRHYYKCKCDCGKTKIADRKTLLNGNTRSCGCLEKENKSKPPAMRRALKQEKLSTTI